MIFKTDLVAPGGLVLLPRGSRIIVALGDSGELYLSVDDCCGQEQHLVKL